MPGELFFQSLMRKANWIGQKALWTTALLRQKRGKGTKWMVVVDGQGVPLGNHLDSASPSEVKLLEKNAEQYCCAT